MNKAGYMWQIIFCTALLPLLFSTTSFPSTTQSTDNTSSKTHVSLHNGIIAWVSDDDDGDKEIYYWDGNSINQLTNYTP